MALFLTVLTLSLPFLPLTDPSATDPYGQFRSPHVSHWLGTDQFGRDVLSRTLWGLRFSLMSAVLAALLAVSVGVFIGGLAGAFGGWLDWALMRLVDVLLAFPGLLLAMALVAILDTGLLQVALAVGISLAPACCRVARAAVLTVRIQLYVEAARVLGADPWRIIARHLLPNAAGQIVAFATVIFAWALLDIAALDYLGLTGSPSIPTWGRMLNEGRAFLRVAPWIAFGPGFLLTGTVVTVTALSDRWRLSLPSS